MNISYKKYYYTEQTYGCGWHCIQTTVSKLFNIDITINSIYNTLKDHFHFLNSDHYGFIDAKMIELFFKKSFDIQIKTIESTSLSSLIETINKFYHGVYFISFINFDICEIFLTV